MANNIGSAFTKSSGPIKYYTNGSSDSGTGMKIISNPDPTKIVVSTTYQIGNNVNTYSDGETVTYTQNVTGNWCYVYFNFPENKNIKGNIGSNTDQFYLNTNEITSGDGSIDSGIYNIDLDPPSVKGTTNTKGYRRIYTYYTPNITYRPDEGLNGTDSKTSTAVEEIRQDGFQAFYNDPDPYGVFSIKLTNNGNTYSGIPKFVTLKKNGITIKDGTYTSSKYEINSSYAYNPYKNDASISDRYYYEVSENKLSTYKKELVFTYDNKYNILAVSGDNLTVYAKAKLNDTYQGFTTSTATDNGFTTYDRTASLIWEFKTYNCSSNVANKSNTETLAQNGKKIEISYTWSLENNTDTTSSWASISPSNLNDPTKNNHVKLQVKDQGAKPGEAIGTLKLNCETSMNPGESKTGNISGISWTSQTNKKERSVTLVNKLKVTNCLSQNIWSSNGNDTDGMPIKKLIVTQLGSNYQSPAFNINNISIIPSASNPNQNIYPKVLIGDEILDSTNKNTNVRIDYNSDVPVKIIAPTISGEGIVQSKTTGKIDVYNTKNPSSSILELNSDGTIDGTNYPLIKLSPSLTFVKGYTKGSSEYNWTLKTSNVSLSSINSTNISGLNKFTSDYNIKVNKTDSSTYFSGLTTLNVSLPDNMYSIKNSPTSTLGMQSTTFSWQGNNNSTSENISGTGLSTSIGSNDRSFYLIGPNNEYELGDWDASFNSQNNDITISSSTKNKNTISTYIQFEATNKEGDTGRLQVITDHSSGTQLTDNTAQLNVTQTGDTCEGKVNFTSTGAANLNYNQIDYPANTFGNATYICQNLFNLASQKLPKVIGIGNVTPQFTLNGSVIDNIGPEGGEVGINIIGEPICETSSDCDQPWTISATSTISQSSISGNHPISGNPIASGIVKGGDVNYSKYYNFNHEGDIQWDSSITVNIPSNTKTLTTNIAPYLTYNDYNNDISLGVFNYYPGLVEYTGTSPIQYSLIANIYCINSRKDFYSEPIYLTQEGEDGSSTIIGTTYEFYTSSNNCYVDDVANIYDENTELENYGRFMVYNIHSPISNPSGNQGIPSNLSTYIYNYYSNIKTDNIDIVGDYSSSLITPGDLMLNADESTICEFRIDSSGDPTVVKKTYTTGSKSWNYIYAYKITVKHPSTNTTMGPYITQKVGNGEYIPDRNEISKTYHKMYRIDTPNGNGEWTIFTESSKAFNTLEDTTGTYRLNIRWATSTDIGDDSTDVYGKKTSEFTINRKTQKYEYYIGNVSLSIVNGYGSKTLTAFDTNDKTSDTWTASVSPSYNIYKVKMVSNDGNHYDPVGEPIDVTNTETNVYTVSVNYDGSFKGTGTTAAHTMTIGSNGNDANQKTITFHLTVSINSSYEMYQQNSRSISADSDSIIWRWYGKTYYNA